MGLGVAAASRLSSVALAQATPASKRFMLFYLPHGVPPEHFQPKVMANDPTTFSLNESGVSILGSLQEQLRTQTSLIQGLKYPKGAMTHEALVVALSGLSNGSALPDDSVPRVTLEHQIANALGVKPLVLGAVPHRQFGLDKDGKLMWDGTPVVPQKNPLAAYDEAFSGLSAAPDDGPDPNVALTEALRALTEAELQGLQQELSALTAEQTKLKTHLESVRALKAGSGGGAISCTTAPTLAAVEELRALSPADDFFLKEENFPKLLAAQLQIAGAALACNARQVVAVQPLYTNCEIDCSVMNISGVSGAHHSALSHTGPQAAADGLNITVRESFAKAQRWLIDQLYTHAITPLLQPDPADPSKKIIDNTIVYVMSEIGEGAWHPTETKPIQLGATPSAISYLPSVIIGGGGGSLKPGRVVTFPTDRPAGDVYLSLCQAMGVTGMFPDATGPVTEVLA